MTTVLTSVAVLAWWLGGMAGFAFWWTRVWGCVKGQEFMVMFVAGGLLGPLSWIVGYLEHGGKPQRRFVVYSWDINEPESAGQS